MKRGRPRTVELTAAQCEVMDLAALGKTRVEMAMILHMTVPAVKSRMDVAKRKLGAANTTLAVARYVKEKIKSEI